ncbi:MAG: hypothetical protein E7559_05680 [Ruminococcaceae bacterium]|nr:hypothetical protein [Oscillospiraceae bacterium]
MADIVGVRFKVGGKVYYFHPNDEYLLQGSQVIVETSRGLECGEVVMERRSVPDSQITHELRSVIRAATEDDIKQVALNREKEKAAFPICEQKIAAHGLDMKLVSVEYSFDGSKILFCFTSNGRVDFRELVRDLAGVFRTRIELRQIGVRDEAKMLGGLGICGRPFCCASFMGDFMPVSIKMAKEQGLSLNPTKISGTCGRLMCCLKYEDDAYSHLIRHTPKQGARVDTSQGRGTVVDVSLLTGMLKLRMDDATPDAPPLSVHKRHVKVLKGPKGEEVLDENFQPEEPYSDIPPATESSLSSIFESISLIEEEPVTEAAPTERQGGQRGGRNGGRNRSPQGGKGRPQQQAAGQNSGEKQQSGRQQNGGKQPSGQHNQQSAGQNGGSRNGKNRPQQGGGKGRPQQGGGQGGKNRPQQPNGEKPAQGGGGKPQGGQNRHNKQGGQNGQPRQGGNGGNQNANPQQNGGKNRPQNQQHPQQGGGHNGQNGQHRPHRQGGGQHRRPNSQNRQGGNGGKPSPAPHGEKQS